jgi:hypothetical protein
MKSDTEVNKMDEFTYNKERFEAEYWLYDCPSADELMLWVSRKAIAGYKNYVTNALRCARFLTLRLIPCLASITSFLACSRASARDI